MHVSGFSKVANKLGPLGWLAGFLIASNSAAAAETEGDHERAKEIMKLWAADATGSFVGESIGAVVGGIAAAALAGAGVAISAPLVGALVLGGTILGGIFGADAATDLYELTKNRDGNENIDLWDKILNAIYGATYTISDPFPTGLDGERLTLNARFSREEMVGNAKTDIAWRYALRELNPFVIPNISYDRHNQDGSLDLYEPATGKGQMTELYLEDRAAMLTWMIRYELGMQDDNDSVFAGRKPYNEDWDTSAVEGNWDFVDFSKRLPGGAPLTLSIDGRGLSLADHQVVFGTKETDSILGGDVADHLYGMAGDDEIKGGKGNDHIEGGIGKDHLEGGEGTDVIYGMDGEDNIRGDKGDDYLFGGEGFDSYIIKSGDGVDIIRDADRQGIVLVDGFDLDDATQVKDNVWTSDDKRFRYMLVTEADGSTTLHVTPLTASADQKMTYIKILEFQSGQFGINLGGLPALPQPPQGDILGDVLVTSDPVAYDSYGNVIGTASADLRADMLLGGATTDVIYGGYGNDVLYGKDGDDRLSGDDGSDLLAGGLGEDHVSGGWGNDTLYGDSTHSTVDLKAGTQVMQPYGTPPYNGTFVDAGIGWIRYLVDYQNLPPVSNANPDAVSSVLYQLDPERFGSKNYTLYQELAHYGQRQGADDYLDGGAGNDILYGEAGNDTIEGGWGADKLHGGSGNDYLEGGTEDDLLMGDGLVHAAFLFTTYDLMGLYRSTAEIERYEDEFGDDMLYGGDGDDFVFGMAGADIVSGGAGNDYLVGDFFEVVNIPMLRLGEDGQTWIQDTETYFQQAVVYHGDDLLDGGDGDDYLVGLAGDDKLYGQAGNDVLVADGNPDEVQGRYGNDYLDGGSDNDFLQGSGGDDELFGGTGDDELWGDEYAGTDGQPVTSWGGAPVNGGSSAQVMDIAKHGRDSLYGGDGKDTLTGGGANDTLDGGSGDDLIFGDGIGVTGSNEGDDSLYGRLGNDQLQGNGGNDMVYGGEGLDKLYGQDGADSLLGEAGDDYLEGGKGDDILDGGDGVDTLWGNDDNDTLLGGAGDDLITGGAGNDTLIGGTGLDNLFGSEGDDVYEFSSGDALVVGGFADTIEDTVGLNRIKLNDLSDISQLSVRAVGQDLILDLSATEAIYIRNGLQGAVATFELGSGGTLGWDTLVAQKLHTSITDQTARSGSFAVGGTANDSFKLGTGNTVMGAGGSDIVVISGSNNTYLFGEGDGRDGVSATVYPTASGQENRLRFGAGIALSDVSMVYWDGGWSDSYVLITVKGNQANSVKVSLNLGNVYANPVFQLFEFSDGTTRTFAEMVDQGIIQYGYESEDTLNGSNTRDILFGNGGNDTLNGGAGSDLMMGGLGDDLMQGGTGADIYFYEFDSGNDQIVDIDADQTAIDTLRLAEGFTLSSLMVGRSGSDLTLMATGVFGSLKLNGQVDQADRRIERFEFSDGTVLTADELLALAGTDPLPIYWKGTYDNETLTGAATNDYLSGLGGHDILYGGAGNDRLEGNADNDTLYGELGDDYLDGGLGTDKLYGGDGADTLIGGSGEYDMLYGDAGNDHIEGGTYTYGGDGDDTMSNGHEMRGELGNDIITGGYHIYGGDGNDTLSGAFSADGGNGNDILYGIVGQRGYLDGEAGDDILYTLGIYYEASGGEGNDYLYGSDNGDYLIGDAGFDHLYGGAGDDTLREDFADGFLDVIEGGAGDDTYRVGGIYATGRAEDTVVERAGEGFDSVYLAWVINEYYLPANVEAAYAGTDEKSIKLVGNDLDNTLVAGNPVSAQLQYPNLYGVDTLIGGKGNDIYRNVYSNDTVIEVANEGIDTVVTASTSYTLGVNIENASTQEAVYIGDLSHYRDSRWLYGNDGNNVLTAGTIGSTTIYGYGGDDTIVGFAGDDYLYGGSGTNTISGSSGSDSISSSGVNDVIRGGMLYDSISINGVSTTCLFYQEDINNPSGGGAQSSNADSVSSSAASAVTLAFADSTLDSLTLRGQGSGLQINWGQNGIARVYVSLGNDYSNLNITTVEGTITAAQWFEWLRAHPSHYTSNVTFYGNGAESLTGARYTATWQDDDLVIGSVDAQGIAFGTVQVSSVTPLDGNFQNVNGTVLWTDAGVDAKTLKFNGFYLHAGTGASDDLTARDHVAYRDFYVGNAGADQYSFGFNSGHDVVDAVQTDGSSDIIHMAASIDRSLVKLERVQDDMVLTITGNTTSSLTLRQYFLQGTAVPLIRFADGTTWDAGAYYLVKYGATAGNDVINGTAAADDMFGWLGNDVLDGLAGNDTLDGGEGSDQLRGGLDDDTYLLRDADLVTENVNEGNDVIKAWVDVVLPANVEQVLLQGSANLNVTGNVAANTITGNSGNNRLDGGAGADTYYGGAGDDLFIYDNTADAAYENAETGIDTVESSVTATLNAYVENLTLTGASIINGTGNDWNNVLRGNSSANVLTGGYGNDTYYIGTGDSVIEAIDAGSDTVIAEMSLTLGNNLENLRLAEVAAALNATGNTLNNTLWGNSLANTLNGGTGADRMEGAGGDDVYVVDHTGDFVVELASQGSDTVQSSVTHVLSANVERLTLTGSSAANGTGNDLDNLMTGNSGTNVFTGGKGNDTFIVSTKDSVVEAANEGIDTVQSNIAWTLGANVENLILTGTTKVAGNGNDLDNRLEGNQNTAINALKGGKGNDTYVVGTGDTVTEVAGEGNDTVESAIAWTLGSNLENLTLTGTTAVNGTGNTLANRLRGNSANNTLTGLAGNDTYLFGRGGGADTIVDSDTTAGNSDQLLLDAGVAYDQLWFRHVGTALEVSIIGTTDKVTVSNWYGGISNQVERIQVADGLYLANNKVEQLVQAMASMTPPPAGQTSLTAAQHQQLDAVLAASWQTA